MEMCGEEKYVRHRRNKSGGIRGGAGKGVGNVKIPVLGKPDVEIRAPRGRFPN